jgi:hypothetical protein
MQVSVFGCSLEIKVTQLTKLLILAVSTLMKRTLKHSKLMRQVKARKNLWKSQIYLRIKSSESQSLPPN